MAEKPGDGSNTKRGKPNTAPGVGRVRLVKRGRQWYARFRTDGHREDVPLKLTNQNRAERKAAEINDALEKGEPWEWTVGRAPTGDRTFAVVVDEWLEKACRWSENTRRGHKSILQQLRAEFGHRSVTEIRSRDIELFGPAQERGDARCKPESHPGGAKGNLQDRICMGVCAP